MPLSWKEIKSRATAFTKEWQNEISEDAEAKSFWDDFFNVFGISRRRVASFEQGEEVALNNNEIQVATTKLTELNGGLPIQVSDTTYPAIYANVLSPILLIILIGMVRKYQNRKKIKRLQQTTY